MTPAIKSQIIELWKRRPDGTKYPAASEKELQDFEERHSKIPEDYRWFLASCGSGVIGSEWCDGIDDLFCSHQKFNEECSLTDDRSWNTKSLFIIGWDGSGSPMGIMPDGRIVVEHPGSEGVSVLAESLALFLITGLS